MLQSVAAYRPPSCLCDIDTREVGTLAPLLLALILLGFVPMPLLDVINPNVEDTLTHVGVTDDPPAVGAISD